MENPMKMRNLDLSLAIGDEILVGQNKAKARITKIEFFEKSGEVVSLDQFRNKSDRNN